LKKGDGTEICIDGDQLQNIVDKSNAPVSAPVAPAPTVPTCTSPEVLDTNTNTCVTPAPVVPTCTSPEVLDTNTNTCVTPAP